MNPEEEKKAASIGITYWELLVLESIALHGPRSAGSGSGATFDAAWALERRGLLRASYVGLSVNLDMTEAGWAKHGEYKALSHHKSPTVEEEELG
jgi:hypothetical protein